MNLFSPMLAAVLLALALPAFGQDANEEAKQLYQKAQELSKDGKHDQAVEAMTKAIKLAPTNDLYLATLSDIEMKAGKYADGLEHALQAIKLNDKVGAYYVLAAANAYGDQELDRAREYCETIFKREKEFGSGAVKDARTIQDLLVPRTYTLFWNLDPQKGRLAAGSLAIALPKTDLPYQSATYEINGVRSSRLVKSDVNDILYAAPVGMKPFTLTTKVTVKPYSFKKELAKATAKPVPADVRAYLGVADGINPQGPAVKKVAAMVKGESPAETARNVLAWMKKNIEYKLDKKPITELDFKTIDEIIERGHAECRGYSLLFVSLCRAADVPARPMWGLARVQAGQDMRFGDIASHNWAEFYVAGVGWVPVDPQKPETLGFLPPTCIRMFMDAKKTRTTQENIPMLNLLFMNGDKLKFDESREK